MHSGISISNISKSYDKIIALNDLSADIQEGELFGFIGPDGAGKTTLFRILATLLLPDSGSANIFGFDVVAGYRKLRDIIGYMPGKFSLYPDLSVEENLTFFATIFNTTINENYHLIKDIYSQIEPFKHRLAGKLSGGMKQKLALSCALIHNPRLLILDDPTTGVDAVSRKEFWDMLHERRKNGLTIIVSTPYMDEAAKCGRIALIQNGRILKTGTPENITDSFSPLLLSVKSNDLYNSLKIINAYNKTYSAYMSGQEIHYTEGTKDVDIESLRQFMEHNGINQVIITKANPSIEDCFMYLLSKQK